MSFANPSTAPTALTGALWSDLLDEFETTLAGGGIGRVLDASGYHALQIYVNLVPLGVDVGPYARVTFDWTDGTSDSYELGFPVGVIDNGSFRVPVANPGCIVTLQPVASPGADTGTLICQIYGTNAPGFGSQAGNGGVLLRSTSNVGAGASASDPIPFYYGPASLYSDNANSAANTMTFMEYESPLGSNTWHRFAIARPTDAQWQPMAHPTIPAKNCRVTRTNFTAGALLITASLIADPTIGLR